MINSQTNIFYGRINFAKNTLLLADEATKIVPLAKSPIILVDFVVDAFMDLYNEFNRLLQQKRLVNSGVLGDITPSRGRVTVNDLYLQHLQQIYNVFIESYINIRSIKLNNLEDFITHFITFLTELQPPTVVTRTNFIILRSTTPLVSGLAIELKQRKYAHVLPIEYFSHVNWRTYQNLTRRYGFNIDFVYPWRIFADINNSIMQQYMRNVETSRQSFFNEYYYESYKLELDSISIVLTQLFNSYLASRPTHSIQEAKVDDFPMEFWLKHLVQIYNLETSANLQPSKIIGIAQKIDTEAALRYINRSYDFSAIRQ